MSTIDSKEITEALGFGLIFASIKAGIDYVSGKKITMMSLAKSGAIAAGADIVYDYGKTKKWWPWN